MGMPNKPTIKTTCHTPCGTKNMSTIHALLATTNATKATKRVFSHTCELQRVQRSQIGTPSLDRTLYPSSNMLATVKFECKNLRFDPFFLENDGECDYVGGKFEGASLDHCG